LICRRPLCRCGIIPRVVCVFLDRRINFGDGDGVGVDVGIDVGASVGVGAKIDNDEAQAPKSNDLTPFACCDQYILPSLFTKYVI